MNQEELLQLIDRAAEDGREELNLSGKGLTKLPEEIGKLKNLTTLDLSTNQISKIPDAIAELKNLTTLDFSTNQISEIPDAIARLQNLIKLHFTGNRIDEIPDAIARLQNLTQLYLTNNKISEIPEEIAKLKKLTEFHLDTNQINRIPDVISELKNLTKLFLGRNKISEVPSAIAELKNLTGLDLSRNKISEIPNTIFELKNITKLDLSSNQISEIPDAISELKNLKTLDLRNNQISEIPETIIQLENLENDLAAIDPADIGGIKIQGNPIINPPYEIAEKGIKPIRVYFRDQQLSRYKDNNIMIKTASIRDKIFVSYSHKDKKWLNEFQTHIKPFVRADGFEIWDDTKIKSGSAWLEEIEKALASAKVAVLLVSPHFIASDFIHNKELPPLFDAEEKEGLTIFWIPIRYSAYAATKIEKYQSAHPPDKPIVSLNTSKRDEAWVNLCKKIAQKMKQSD